MANAEVDLEKLDAAFKALAHSSRRKILAVLKAHGGCMTAGEIAARFSCAWPTTSRHLRILQGAGLVSIDKQGREWVYRLERKAIAETVGGWARWFQ